MPSGCQFPLLSSITIQGLPDLWKATFAINKVHEFHSASEMSTEKSSKPNQTISSEIERTQCQQEATGCNP